MAKNTGRGRSEQSRGKGGSLLTGLFLGLLVGAVIAIGVALYINRNANPFFGNKTASETNGAKTPAAPAAPEVLRPAGGKNDSGSAVATASQPATQKASSADRFDFYTVLPGLNEKGSKEPKKADASQPAKTETNKVAWLQVGAFQKEQDADNLKAKLALIGIEARIQTVQLQDKGTWHRVRVGPYTSPEALDKARAQLQANGIESSVAK